MKITKSIVSFGNALLPLITLPIAVTLASCATQPIEQPPLFSDETTSDQQDDEIISNSYGETFEETKTKQKQKSKIKI